MDKHLGAIYLHMWPGPSEGKGHMLETPLLGAQQGLGALFLVQDHQHRLLPPTLPPQAPIMHSESLVKTKVMACVASLLLH